MGVNLIFQPVIVNVRILIVLFLLWPSLYNNREKLQIQSNYLLTNVFVIVRHKF